MNLFASGLWFYVYNEPGSSRIRLHHLKIIGNLLSSHQKATFDLKPTENPPKSYLKPT